MTPQRPKFTVACGLRQVGRVAELIFVIVLRISTQQTIPFSTGRRKLAQMEAAELLKEGQRAFFGDPPDYQKAKELFARATQASPKWSEGFIWFASTLDNLGNRREAAAAYRTATEIDPRDPRPRIALGVLLTEMGHPREGVIELLKGVELKPHYGEADARLYLAEAYVKAGDTTKAKEQLEVVRSMEPCYPSYDVPIREAERRLKEMR